MVTWYSPPHHIMTLSVDLVLSLIVYFCLPGICDAVFHSHANSALECSFTDLATSYVGVISQTRTGLTCQYWSRQIPHAHALTDDVMFPDQSVEAARNYCRNPSGLKAGGVWCYVLHDHIEWEYCNIPKCDCRLPPHPYAPMETGDLYKGPKQVTLSGAACLRWEDLHTAGYEQDVALFPDKSLREAQNFCRNPGGAVAVPWCYTDIGGNQWEVCDVPVCNCRHTDAGVEYVGTTNVTAGGATCQRWDHQEPWPHPYNQGALFPELSISFVDNYCRNPSSSQQGPWCYTISGSKSMESCEIPKCEFSAPMKSLDTDKGVCSASQSCRLTVHGEEYVGSLATTISGLTCQRWDSQYPHTHDEVTRQDAENYCRNPDGRALFPWCFTTDRTVRWQYCDIPLCDEKVASDDCRTDDDLYTGQRSTTVSGHMCQRWDQQYPQQHKYTSSEDFHDEDIHDAGNFCRRLGNEQFPWCYTTNQKVKWEYCDIPRCPVMPVSAPLLSSTGMLVAFGCAGGVAIGILLLGLFVTIITIRRVERRKLDLAPMTPLRMIPVSTQPRKSYDYPDVTPRSPSLRVIPCSPTVTPRTTRYFKRPAHMRGGLSPTRNSAPPLSRSCDSLLSDRSDVTNKHAAAYLQIISEDSAYLPMDGRMSMQSLGVDATL